MKARLALIFLVAAGSSYSAPLFDEETVLDITLTGPLGTLFEDTSVKDELPFTLSTDEVDFGIEARLRGRSRLRVCEFPPLRLKFPGSDLDDGVFAGQDKLKLVTHCRNYDRAEQDLLQEFAAYRIFNVISDASYRVRLLRLEYIDTDDMLDDKASPRYGFVIEPIRQLAERLGAVAVELQGVPEKRHDLEQAALIYIFQYMIANTDWGFVKADYDDGCCHNISLLEVDSQILTVPYDLDLAGLVNAQYAFPDPILRIKRVTQRLYRGLCTDRDVLRSALRRVVDQRAEILDVLHDIPGLSDANIEDGTRFLEAFFDRARDQDKLLKSFERRCL